MTPGSDSFRFPIRRHMDHVKRDEFKRNATRLRQVAEDLRRLSPSISTKADALASELEIRALNIERGITP